MAQETVSLGMRSMYPIRPTLPAMASVAMKDSSSTLTDLQTVESPNCPYVAQYVTIYNYRNDPKRQSWYSDYAALALCEVEVKGCPIGSHGYGNCESRCSSDCYGGNCHSTTGYCFYCFPGKYGERCQYTCPTDCANGCNITSGYCTECSAGIYGVTCQNNCPINCKDGICNINSGYCTECISGKFGDDCQQNCSVNCLNGLCYRENGTCHDCVVGKYGINCDNYCRSGCDRETGLYIGISFHNQICIRMFDIIFGICILQSYLPLRVGIDCDVMCLRA
ncbi:multiple epidermal growth factor-like domains protein 10 [Argopecten irradians]|uniref:multiple epidermal growth factor-like domains protein 10 n=1 Tax=Argopecten irradians TaxID=31199 RepID=UPI003717FFD4